MKQTPFPSLPLVHSHSPWSVHSCLRDMWERHAVGVVPCGVLLAGPPWMTHHPLLHTLLAMIMHYMQMFVLLVLLLLLASLLCILLSLLQKDKVDVFWPVKQIHNPFTSRSGLHPRDRLENAILWALEIP